MPPNFENNVRKPELIVTFLGKFARDSRELSLLS